MYNYAIINYMTTQERLVFYYPFKPDVITTVSEAMERQASFGSYAEVFAAAHVTDPVTFSLNGYSDRKILDIRPPEHDDAEALVVHLPMANPLDTNQLYQAASLALSMPNTRIIGMAHPSGAGFTEGGLSWKQRVSVAHGDFQPVIDPLAAYLEKNNIEKINNVGTSYGAELAAKLAAKGSVAVLDTVYVEPASIVRRTTLGLGLRFKSSEPAMDGYVAANGLQTFVDARNDGIGGNDYVKGLLRLSNIAISRGLAAGRFEKHAVSAIKKQPDMYTTFAWGTASELAKDVVMTNIIGDYVLHAKPHTVSEIRIPGEKHALGNDLALANAIIHQALKH